MAHPHQRAESHGASLKTVETKLEQDLAKHNYHDFLQDLKDFRDHDKGNFKHDLKHINKHLHKDGYLPGLEIEEKSDGNFNLAATGKPPEQHAPRHYAPPPGGYDAGGGNRGGGGGGYGGGSAFSGDVGGDGGTNSDSGSSEGAGLPSSGPDSFDNYDGTGTTDGNAIADGAAGDLGRAMWQGWGGTDNGVEGCAASVSQILDDLGAAHLSSAAGDALCSTMQKHLQEQGWTVTNKPQPGDVVIGYGGLSSAHTGIVGKNGTVMDNHSSTGKWSKDNLSYFSNWNQVVFLHPPQKTASTPTTAGRQG